MIVRKQGDNFILFKQFDHSKMSGLFASYWRERPIPYEAVHYAIKNHDRGWRQLDAIIKWDDNTNEPYSFTTYPLHEKIPAYIMGIDIITKEDPYAGYLCSHHFAKFLKGNKDPEAAAFYQKEIKRQQQLKKHFTKEQSEQVESNYELLKVCDDLSLFICLNEPGENTFPWFKNGITMNKHLITPTWINASTVTFSPNPFRQSFEVTIPYMVVNEAREIVSENEFVITIK